MKRRMNLVMMCKNIVKLRAQKIHKPLHGLGFLMAVAACFFSCKSNKGDAQEQNGDVSMLQVPGSVSGQGSPNGHTTAPSSDNSLPAAAASAGVLLPNQAQSGTMLAQLNNEPGAASGLQKVTLVDKSSSGAFVIDKNIISAVPSLAGNSALSDKIPEIKELVSSEGDEQFFLFPQQSAALQEDVTFFQRRYSFDQRFKFFAVAKGDENGGELLQTIPQVADAMVYCPRTKEIVLLAPPIGQNGKFNLKARPTRVYLFSLETGSLQLIWRKSRDLDGGFVPRLSATPDCQHVLVNQRLEKQDSKTPYGQLVHIKRPTANKPNEDWSFSTINETNANGYWLGFSDAVFLLPRDPNKYVASELPPAVFAVTEMINKDKDSPLLNVFYPSVGEKRKDKKFPANFVSWQRKRSKSGEAYRDFSSPVFGGSLGEIYMLGELKETNSFGVNTSLVVSVSLGGEDLSVKEIFVGKDLSFFSLDVSPSGKRFALSYLLHKKASEIENLDNKKLAGVAEAEISEDAKSLTWRGLAEFLPFHALAPHHHPRATYSVLGNRLFFVIPEIAALPEPGLYVPLAKPNDVLQFRTKIFFKEQDAK